jgi:hypothetical protein
MSTSLPDEAEDSDPPYADVYGHVWPGDEDRGGLAVDGMFTPRAEDRLRTDTADEP